MKKHYSIFDGFNDREIIILLLDFFFEANSMMIERDASEIRKDVSERCICANIKEMINNILNSVNIYDYYADVEYNRGDQRLIKAVKIKNEDKPIQCDLIVHSRGKNKEMDNLLCLEMKKKNGRVGDDRERLCELTRPEFHYKSKALKEGFQRVCGYKIGIFYIYDYITETVILEFYYHGKKVDEVEMALWELQSSSITSEYVRRLVNKIFKNSDLKDAILSPFPVIREPNPFLVFFNMGFGDSFLIDGDSSRLLVDCGSKEMPDADWKNRIVEIKSYLKEDPNLLITHYHGDHLNKIPELSDDGVRFNTIYVRNLGSSNLQFDITNAFVQLAIYASSTGDFRPLFFWLDPRVLFKLLVSGGKVVCVNSSVNNYINIGCLTANVLWPDVSDKSIKEKLEKADCLNALKKYETVYAHLYKLINLYFHLLGESEDGVIPYSRLEELNRECNFELSEAAKEKIKDEVSAFSKDEETAQLRKELSDFENYLSIIFSINRKLLMTGDAKRSAIRRALRNMKGVIFNIYKAPHHGTKRYYRPYHWNNKSIVLIPNSLLYSGWGVDKRYCNPKSMCDCLNPDITDSACPLASSCHHSKRGKTSLEIFYL